MNLGKQSFAEPKSLSLVCKSSASFRIHVVFSDIPWFSPCILSVRVPISSNFKLLLLIFWCDLHILVTFFLNVLLASS